MVDRISPMLAIEDMKETISFYIDILGFTEQMTSPDYSIIVRDGSTIHLMKAASGEIMNCVRGHTQIYIEVSDIDSLWRSVEAHKDRFKVRDLFDQIYGMREFHIEDPNGCLVFIGQPTKQAEQGAAPDR